MAQHKSKKPIPLAGRDSTTVNVNGNGNATATHSGTAIVSNNESLPPGAFNTWRKEMENEIEKLKSFPEEDKATLKEEIAKIAREAEKGDETDANRLERLLNSIGAMAPDIFDVVIATLASPLAGISLTIKKIGDKAKVMQKA